MEWDSGGGVMHCFGGDYCRIRGINNLQRQKFSGVYLNYPYNLLCSVPTSPIVLMVFWCTR